MGSSPLARGLLPAGTDFGATVKDHPRSRGVYATTNEAGGGVHGSSPLARGLQLIPACELALVRIIPARAGFTVLAVEGHDLAQDHPRSRGVYSGM